MDKIGSWKQFQSGHRSIEAEDKIVRAIIRTLGAVIEDFFSYDTRIRPQRTRFIKDTLAVLGRDTFGYKVYANGLSPELTQLEGGTFKNTEWLFDLHWYVEGKAPYTTTRLPLVVECEWQQKRKGDKIVAFSGIKYDFQKLLVSNAELRLMIFKVVRPSDFEQLTAYFQDNINHYKHLPTGAKFLFVAFYQKGKTFYYTEIQKR